MMNKFFIALFAVLFFFPLKAQAQIESNNNAPVEISADNSLEWLQNKNQYIANGNVEAKQGNLIILTDQLIADYKDNKTEGSAGGNTEIWQLTAIGTVRIKDTQTTAIGDQAIYNIETGLATLTGEDLKLTTPDQIITAQERMEYNANTGIAKAIGNAKIIEGTNTLTAQNITANFEKDATGKQILKTATATGGVKIKTDEETLTGNSGIYNATNNTAVVTGNVKIVRGKNILEGEKGEVNLTTNISKMFGAPEKGKRVKGVFFPSSNKGQPSKEGVK